MTKLIVCISAILFLFSSSDSKEKKIIALYSAISCPCAQWKVIGEKENIYLEREKIKDFLRQINFGMEKHYHLKLL